MKTILVPTDFSKPAQIALDVTVTLAKKAKASIVLLHVVEQPVSDSFNVEGEVDSSLGWEERIFIKKLI
jgi:nucleotide-binding universal stress UspA family protein